MFTMNHSPSQLSYGVAQQYHQHQVTSTGLPSPMSQASPVLSSPTSSIASSDFSSRELVHCKLEVDYDQNASPQTGSHCGPQRTSTRRNERERNRVKLVNMGFATLRNHVPSGAKNKKMSKVDTLRSAVEYIKELQTMLNDADRTLEMSFMQTMDNFVNENCKPTVAQSCSRSPSPCISMDSNYCSSPEGTGYVTAATCPMRSSGSSSVSCLTPPKSEHNGHSGHPDAHHLYLQSSMSSHNHQAAFSSSAEEVDDESLYTTHTESFYMQNNYHE